MSVIYLVVGEPQYEEGYRPIRAFATESDADAFITACAVYDRTVPQAPAGGNFAEWEAYRALLNPWKSAHPAGKHTYYTHMSCTEIEFIP